MKIFVAVLLAAAVGFGAAFSLTSRQHQTKLEQERAKWEAQAKAERDALEAALAEAKKQDKLIEEIEKQVTVTAPRRTPEEILQKLLTLKPAGAVRIRAIRQIVHELEDLAELKTAALPAIQDFLRRNEDMDYSIERSDSDGDRRWTPFWQRSSPPTEFTLPPSLRIGLFDVLKEIGGEGAEQVLAEVLENSGRAVEVAYVTRALEELAPGRYREMALNAAKDLLRNPLPIDNPNRLDEQAEGYLYGILELYGDTSFADEAKRLLVDAEGHLNRNAQRYLTQTQGENVVATFYDIYKNSSVSNNWDRMSVANRILDYVGPNAQANAFLNEVVMNTNIDSRMRSFAVMRLAGGFGGVESPTDPNVIRQRMEVVNGLGPNVDGDERLARTILTTRNNLQNLLEGKPVESPWGRDGRDGRDGRSDGRGR